MNFVKVSRRVFNNPRYFLVSVLAALGLFCALSLLPHTALLRSVVLSGDVSAFEKFNLVVNLLSLAGVNNSVVGKVVVVLTAVLFGVQAAFLLFYIRRRRTSGGASIAQAASLSGLVAAVFGIGCAACGSVVLTAFLSLIGGTALLTLLPLHGLEFGLLGLGLLIFAVLYLAKKINDPLVCTV